MAPRRFQRRRPTMCTSAARKALAVRTTDPMLKSCCQFSMATWNGCRRGAGAAGWAAGGGGGVGGGVVARVGGASDPVGAAAAGQQIGIEAGIVGPRLDMGA